MRVVWERAWIGKACIRPTLSKMHSSFEPIYHQGTEAKGSRRQPETAERLSKDEAGGRQLWSSGSLHRLCLWSPQHPFLNSLSFVLRFLHSLFREQGPFTLRICSREMTCFKDLCLYVGLSGSSPRGGRVLSPPVGQNDLYPHRLSTSGGGSKRRRSSFQDCEGTLIRASCSAFMARDSGVTFPLTQAYFCRIYPKEKDKTKPNR